MSIADDIQSLLDEYHTPPAVRERVEAWIAAQRSGGTLDAAWDEAMAATPQGWGMSVAADGPGYVARASQFGETQAEAWSVAYPDLVGDPDIPSSPAKALYKLAAKLRATRR